MKRHIPDQTAAPDSGLRTREFLRIERESTLHPSIRTLNKRGPTPADSDTGLSQFLRIERGVEA